MLKLIHTSNTFNGLPLEDIDAKFSTPKLQYIYNCLVKHPCGGNRIYIIRALLHVPEQPNLSFPWLSTESFETHLLAELRWDGEREHLQDEAYYRERALFAWDEVDTYVEGKHRRIYRMALFIDAELYEKMFEYKSELRTRLQIAWCRTLKMEAYEPGRLVSLTNAPVTELDKANPEYFNDLAHTFQRLSFFARLDMLDEAVLRVRNADDKAVHLSRSAISS